MYHKSEKTPGKGCAGWRRNVLSAHCSGVLPLAKLLHNVTWSFRKAETPLQSGVAGLRSRQAPRYIVKGVFSFSEHKLRIAGCPAPALRQNGP
jgi:hypothetical protein